MTPTIRPFVRRLVLVAGLLACMTASAVAQLGGGIRGLVRDPDGTGIAGATVTAESLETSVTRSTTTNGSGRFAFIGLARGEWLFVINAQGFEPISASADVRRAGSPARVQITMQPDIFNPRAPTVGVLAGLTASELISSLEAAEELLYGGAFDEAIDAYRSILEQAPALTSVHLPIGHAFREKQQPDQALAAYQAALAADPGNAEVLAAIDAVSQTQTPR